MFELDWDEPQGWPEDADRDRLIGDWWLYHRRGGHRSSTDDVLSAWFAVHRTDRSPLTYLDLGCGVGSVLMMVAHRLRPQHAVGVEAQAQSVAMVRRAIQELPPGAPPMEVVHGDFRSFASEGPGFDLVTGSPPYFPLGTGVLPHDPQRRACRFEARGGIESYCETAARCLGPAGKFYVVFQSAWHDRVCRAATAVGLHITAQVDASMRMDRGEPFLSVYEMSQSASPATTRSLAIRDTEGAFTEDYRQARRELGVE